MHITRVKQALFYAPHHHGEVALAELGNHYTDSEGLLRSKRSSQPIRLVLELLCRGQNASLGLQCNGLYPRSVVQHQRDRRRTQLEMLGQSFKADTFGISLFVVAHARILST